MTSDLKMPEKMSWKECTDKKIITKSTPDNERAVQITSMAKLRLEFWSKKMDDKFIALKVEAY